MDSVLIPWITQSFKHVTGAVHREHIMKEDWRQIPPYTALYKSWRREWVLFQRAKIWVIEPYHILLSHPHTPRKHQLHKFIRQSDCMVRGIEGIWYRSIWKNCFLHTYIPVSEHCSIYRKLIIETELISVKLFPHNPVSYMALLTSTIPEMVEKSF